MGVSGVKAHLKSVLRFTKVSLTKCVCEPVDCFQAMIGEDSTLCLEKTLPQIKEKTESLDQLFKRIDNLERFVGETGFDIWESG